MADIYVYATGGNDTTGTGSSTAPYATKGKAESVATAVDTIILIEDAYNEDVSSFHAWKVKGNGERRSVINGSLLSNYAVSAKLLIENLEIKNFGTIIYISGYTFVNNCFFKDSDNLAVAPIGVARLNLFTNNIIANIPNLTGSILNFNNSGQDYRYNTIINSRFKHEYSNCSLLYNWILADVEYYYRDTANVNKLDYSIFYGNCKVYNGANFINVTSLTDLTTNANGNFANCLILADIQGTVTDNGLGKVKVTKSAHGLNNGQYITIRRSTNNAYVTNRISVIVTSTNTFELAINFNALDAVLYYNEPLFINEFAGDFRVWVDSKACMMNPISPNTPIGACSAGVWYDNDNFAFTSNIETENENGYTLFKIQNENADGTIVAGSYLNLEQNTINKISFNAILDYLNGRIIATNNQIRSTIYNAGDTLTAGYYTVENGIVTYNSINRNIDDVFAYVAGQPTFTTSAGGVVRKLDYFSPRKFAIKIQVVRNNNESLPFYVYLDEEILVNYAENDPLQIITKGNADTFFDSAHAFTLNSIQKIKILAIKMQNGDNTIKL